MSFIYKIHDKLYEHIVHGYCDKNDIPYIEKPSIFPAITSSVNYLYMMGNP